MSSKTSRTVIASATAVGTHASSHSPAWHQGSVLDGGQFRNPFSQWVDPKAKNALKWAMARKAPREPKPHEIRELFGVDHQPAIDLPLLATAPPSGALRYTWIGHATTFVQFGPSGMSLLTDPVFSDRCSPVQFAGPKRYVLPPCKPSQLPRVDCVLVSHNHYDHLDTASIKELATAFPDAKFLCGLGLGAWFKGISGLESSRVVELDWWQSIEMPAQKDSSTSCKVTFVPAQHWSRRGLGDTCKTLWGGFVCQCDDLGYYFAGDTGYSDELFAEIGQRFAGRIDLAAVPIGAYEPRWFMKPQHVDPAEAIRIVQHLRARKAVGIHWGTFVLTDEPVVEPRDLLLVHCKELGVHDTWVIAKHGDANLFHVPGDGGQTPKLSEADA